MEFIPGPTMVESLQDDPSDAEARGRALAALHRTLDRVRPDHANLRLVHGDLHPGNVVLGDHGPVLLNWTNHRRADRALDLALTWIILACFEPPATLIPWSALRPPVLGGFLGAIDLPAAAAALSDAAQIRRTDPATTSAEHDRIDQLLRDAGRTISDRRG